MNKSFLRPITTFFYRHDIFFLKAVRYTLIFEKAFQDLRD